MRSAAPWIPGLLKDARHVAHCRYNRFNGIPHLGQRVYAVGRTKCSSDGSTTIVGRNEIGWLRRPHNWSISPYPATCLLTVVSTTPEHQQQWPTSDESVDWITYCFIRFAVLPCSCHISLIQRLRPYILYECSCLPNSVEQDAYVVNIRPVYKQPG
jgi:hypothetical protein